MSLLKHKESLPEEDTDSAETVSNSQPWDLEIILVSFVTPNIIATISHYRCPIEKVVGKVSVFRHVNHCLTPI